MKDPVVTTTWDMSWSIAEPTVTARDSLETRTDHDHDGLFIKRWSILSGGSGKRLWALLERQLEPSRDS